LPLVYPKLTSGHRTQISLDAYGNGVAADNTKERPNSDARVSPKTETGEHVVIRTKGALGYDANRRALGYPQGLLS
jgi:hypothetical protein